MGKLKNARLRKDGEIVETLHPLVKEWFFNKFGNFSLPQKFGVMPIWERKNILISAPTGGTKTLTAFLSILNYLVNLADKGELEDKIYAVYVSPLKALSNDIHVNLTNPLKEIMKMGGERGRKLQEIRVGLRTGDTPTKERSKQRENPPHILITTPETLAIVLNAKKFSNHFFSLEYLIVDEIHSLDNKRGVHLSLSLERLEEMSAISPVRIGLSATIAPLKEIAKFLTGGRECIIADIKFDKSMDVEIRVPVEKLTDTNGGKIRKGMYDLIDNLIQEHKTTLIFTNTRAATERVVHHLKEKFPENYSENIGAHHGSLSKSHRFGIEERLRRGELKVVVSSTSLELGIDIGYIDLVILLGSPKSTARALQRIGRAGHKLHETAKGRFIVMDRDDLVECSVMKKEIIERKIDRVHIPKNCLDVLSQQIYGMAINKKWKIEEMFKLIKRSYCYNDLEWEDFLSVISYLRGDYALEDKHVYAKIWYDEDTNMIGKRGRLARVIYMTNIGTIPDESYVGVYARGSKEKIGVIDEGFLEKLKKGDVFVLGGSKYQYLYSRGMKVYVNTSVQRPPTIPSWFSEQLPLSFDLALEISRFRKLIDEKIGKKEGCEKFIRDFCYVSKGIVKRLYDYFLVQHKYAGIPSEKKIIIERYKAEKEYWIFHTLFGRRVNDALSRAFAYLLGQIGGRDIEIGISDNGFYFVGEDLNKQKIEKVFGFLDEDKLGEILKEAIEKTQLLKRRFRHCAGRSLMILRQYKGRKKSAGVQQLRSRFILGAVRKISQEFPILKEAKREILEDVMDLKNAKKVIRWIKNNKMEIKFVNNRLPSPFAINLIMQARYDLIKIENKMEFLKRIHKEIEKQVE
jgi:ATP-dependent Lhr-like helicase